MGHQEHEQRAQAEAPQSIRCGVITISDTRTPETDTSGAAIRAALEAAGHTVTRYQSSRTSRPRSPRWCASCAGAAAR